MIVNKPRACGWTDVTRVIAWRDYYLAQLEAPVSMILRLAMMVWDPCSTIVYPYPEPWMAYCRACGRRAVAHRCDWCGR